jgi:hypothetical protein
LCIAFLILLTPITWGAPTDVKRLATPARRRGVAGHANCLSVPNRASVNVAIRALAREHGGRLPHGEGWIARGVEKTMTREEISQAREIAQACEASNYRSCEY